MVATLHFLAYVATNGRLRTTSVDLWRPSITISEDFSMVLFKFGRACLLATESMGFANEMEPVVISKPSSAKKPIGFERNDQFWIGTHHSNTSDPATASRM